jgi:L-amino acid N-acyltransferase YncA
MTMTLTIREGVNADLPAIVEIFNQAIHTRASVGYLKDVTVEERKTWFSGHTKDYPLFVAEQDNAIVGWISLNPYRKGRDAFKRTVEADCFVRNGCKGQGIGNKLLQHLLQQARKRGYHTMLAIVLDHNIVSRKLLENHGFKQWGFLEEIGEIDGMIVNHVYYGKKL